MKAEIYEKIQKLRRCTFLPASYDKRFVRQMHYLKPEKEITEKQEAFVNALFYKYRKQIGVLHEL